MKTALGTISVSYDGRTTMISLHVRIAGDGSGIVIIGNRACDEHTFR